MFVVPYARLKIQYKIVIPFTLLFIITTLSTALVSILLMSRDLDARIDAQLDQASQLLERSAFALNPSILTSLKTVIGADIITYKSDGAILATTLSGPLLNNLAPVVLSGDVQALVLTGAREFTIRQSTINGLPYKIAYRRLVSTPGALIAVVADTSNAAKTRNTIAKLVLLISAFVVFLMSLIGHAIAKGLTGPTLRLVDFTKKVAAGERTKAPITSRDEVGVLTAAFNDMVEQLKKFEERVVQSEKLALTGLLAARVAHEVRNPLSAIKMQAQLLRSKLKERGDDSESELIVSVLHGIDRVEWVVRGMLNLASPQALHLEKEDVLQVVDEVLDLMEPQLRHLKVTIRKRFDSSVPLLMLDRDRLKLALSNLIVNATEAMTNGGTLEVMAHWSETRDSVVIEIVDDGMGIHPSIEGRLFDPFVTTKREGVGLGLVNTKNMVEAHHGTVKLVPREGRGTRAIIELPIRSQ